MKEVKNKKIRASIKILRKSVHSASRRAVSELEFWKRTALQQQVLLHAKNKT